MIVPEASENEWEAVSAFAGSPLTPGTEAASEADVVDALMTVFDPEIPVNIYDLGLIYDLAVDLDGSVRVVMTLTAPACPVAGQISQDVAFTVATVDGVGEVEVSLVWEPPWTPDRMSVGAKLALGIS